MHAIAMHRRLNFYISVTGIRLSFVILVSKDTETERKKSCNVAELRYFRFPLVNNVIKIRQQHRFLLQEDGFSIYPSTLWEGSGFWN
jgi:hypothetical protein